ncbi:MAG: substrate-binding domain-containing protein [Oscillospiraceae bacterium]|jgi:phosphate transport system substrate-binding protein|nr:substrate-binding domain-containing protein [Oscillospiraceae bacterium]
MKKSIKRIVLAIMLALAATGCAAETAAVNSAPIYVISREEGSGTRSAFIELFGVEQKDADGNKVDYTVDSAEITNSTSVMLLSVAGDKNAIGYISLGSLDASVKALSIDGVAPSVETVKDGTYKVSRPFNIVTKGGLSEGANDFVKFILSAEGQAVVSANGYIGLDGTEAFTTAKPSGKIVVAGSSSVSPIMEKLAEAYAVINPALTVDIQQSDSTTGVNSAIDGICDVGMASRELKDSEIEKGLTQTKIAIDGLVVIVNLNNAVSNAAAEQIKGVYTGELTTWADIR